MTNQDFNKQLKALCEQMMLTNTGYKSVDDFYQKTPDFDDLQTEEEKAQWEASEAKVAKTADTIANLLQAQLKRI